MRRAALTAFGLLIAAGCGARAAQPPQQLADARRAYQVAAEDPAAMLIADDLAEARRSLDAAERSFQEHGAASPTESLAYVAQRRAVAVRAKADAMRALEDKRMALAELDRLGARHEALSREQLERERGQLVAMQQEAAERRARAAAEEKVHKELSGIAGVKSEDSARGVTVTLSGADLFHVGKADILPKGKEQLDQIAKALEADQRRLLVEGYTDSTGSARLNERLSAERADAVRKYLVDHGIDAGRIRAEGLGQRHPIADNATAQGRAANRRVEIIVEHAAGTEQAPELHQRREDQSTSPPR